MGCLALLSELPNRRAANPSSCQPVELPTRRAAKPIRSRAVAPLVDSPRPILRRPVAPARAAQVPGNLSLMTNSPAAIGDQPSARIRIGSAEGILAVIPHLLGFHPGASVVVLGICGRTARIRLTCRYDLPNPPAREGAAEIAAHAVAALRRERDATAVVVGYGPGAQVTPAADALGAALRRAGIGVRDILRVQDGRYWSYLCQDPGCCPPDGTPFDPAVHPAAAALREAGQPVLADRAALAKTLARLPGTAEAMDRACQRALGKARMLIDQVLDQAGQATDGVGLSGRPPEVPVNGPPGVPPDVLPEVSAQGLTDALSLVVRSGRRAIRSAIAVYRGGGAISDPDQLAWLGVTLTDLRVRDDAWARMDPDFRAAHQRLWSDLVRHLPAAYVAAPAALLAFAAWQSGDGALASIAIERALEADPEYSMAKLIGRAVDAAIPPSAARPPLTPRQVAASYRRRATRRVAQARVDRAQAVRAGDAQRELGRAAPATPPVGQE
jgi:hypothetical protein